MEKTYQYVDLSGYICTGKQAVIDLLREFRGYCVPGAAFEFCLLRVQGGIHDLDWALNENWSPVRSDAAVRRFKRLVKRLGCQNRWNDPRTWATAIGASYNAVFNGKFFYHSDCYIKQLVQASWKADWPYPLCDLSGGELFLKKLKRQLRIPGALDFDITLACPTNFVKITKDYLKNLLSERCAENDHAIVMHNAFEPFNPQRSFKFFDKAKCIIIDRDPRDSYIDQLSLSCTRAPIEEYIKRYKLYRNAVVPGEGVLRIKFEELVYNYEEIKQKILTYLEEDESVHIAPKKYFDPKKSIKNVGKWRYHSNQGDIDLICRELREFCFEPV